MYRCLPLISIAQPGDLGLLFTYTCLVVAVKCLARGALTKASAARAAADDLLKGKNVPVQVRLLDGAYNTTSAIDLPLILAHADVVGELKNQQGRRPHTCCVFVNLDPDA